MLKLMKYELKHSMRSFFVSFLVFWFICLLFPIVTEGLLAHIPWVMIVMSLAFIVLLIGITVALFVSIFTNYYRSMFKRPAYLTLTLPVASWQLVLSKALVSMIWLVVGVFVLLIGFALIGIVVSIQNHALSIDNFMLVIERFWSGFAEYTTLYPLVFVNDLIFVIAKLFLMVVTIYFSLTIVHTKYCRSHQLVMGIIVYIAISFLIGVCRIDTVVAESVISAYTPLGTVITLLWGVALIGGTVYIIDHHLEVE